MTGLTVPTTAAVSSLRQALIQHGYAAILQALIPTEGHERAFCDFGRVARACEKLGDESAALLRLFALGEKLPLRLAERLFDREALGGLIGCGLLREPSGGEVQTAGYAVVSYRGFCCVADLPPRYPTAVRLRRDVVIDDDTLALAGFVTHAGEHFVEACAGAGLLSIVASRRARSVVGGDLNPHALAAARFNAVLNRVDDRVRFVESDLFENLPASSATTLVVNPPYVPMPQPIGTSYLAGDGGRDGLAILRRCLAELSNQLLPQASAFACAGGLARDSELLCAEELRTFARDEGLRIQCTVIGDFDIEQLARFNAHAMPNPSEYRDGVMAHARESGADRYWAFVLRIRRSLDARGLTVLRPAVPVLAQRPMRRSEALAPQRILTAATLDEVFAGRE